MIERWRAREKERVNAIKKKILKCKKKNLKKKKTNNKQQLLYDIRIHFNVIFLIIYMYTNNMINENKKKERWFKKQQQLQSNV